MYNVQGQQPPAQAAGGGPGGVQPRGLGRGILGGAQVGQQPQAARPAAHVQGLGGQSQGVQGVQGGPPRLAQKQSLNAAQIGAALAAQRAGQGI